MAIESAFFPLVHRVSTGWAWVGRTAHGATELSITDPGFTRVDRVPLAAWPIGVSGIPDRCVDIAVVDDELLFDCWVGVEREHAIYAFGLDGRLARDPLRTGVRGGSGRFATVLDETGYHFAVVTGYSTAAPVRVDMGGAVTMGASTTLPRYVTSALWNGSGWTMLHAPDFTNWEIWELSERGGSRRTGVLELPPSAGWTYEPVVTAEAVLGIAYVQASDSVLLVRGDPVTGRWLQPPVLVSTGGVAWNVWGSREPASIVIPEERCGTGVLLDGLLGRITPDDHLRQTLERPSDRILWIGDRYLATWRDAAGANWLDVTLRIE